MSKITSSRLASRTRTLVLTTAFLLLSLMNHWVIPWFGGTILLGAYCWIFRIPIGRKIVVEGGILVGALLLFALKFQVSDWPYVAQESVNSFSNNLAIFCYLIFNWILLRAISISQPFYVLHGAIAAALWVHIGFFSLQFLTFFATGNFIDFIEPFTGEASRPTAFDQSLTLIGSFRATGLFAEPSNYSSVALLLLAATKIGDGFKIDALFTTTIATVLLSFSTAGLVVSLLFILVTIFKNGGKLMVVAGFAVVTTVFAWLFFDEIAILYFAQEAKFFSSSEIRTGLWQFVFSREGRAFALGYGPFGFEDSLIQGAIDSTGRRVVASLNDSGVLVFLLLNFGVLGFVFYALMGVSVIGNAPALLMFLLISLTKIGAFHPLWAAFIALLIRFAKGQRSTQVRRDNAAGGMSEIHSGGSKANDRPTAKA